MKTVVMKKFGTVLTGRPYGAQSYNEVKKEIENNNVELDFTAVSSLGSSFGEEFIVPLAKNQNNSIRVRSANAPIRDCLDLIVEDFKIKVEYV